MTNELASSMMASPTNLVIQKRNILVLGKAGAGKSTVANKIVGSVLFEVGKEKEAIVTRDGIQ